MDAFFFGYGSLVNRRTHGYDPAFAAQAQGWRRAWRATETRRIAYLTVLPDPGSVIDGLVAAVPGRDWDALDAREAAYDRLDATGAALHDLPGAPAVAIYAIPAGAHHPPDDRSPILQSYLDVVMQGFLHQFGAEGLARFVATTDGWHAPVLQDRAAPVYPRHQSLTAAERRILDDVLDSLAVRRLPLNSGVFKDGSDA